MLCHLAVQARLKYLIAEWGLPRFRAVAEQYYGKQFQPFRWGLWSGGLLPVECLGSPQLVLQPSVFTPAACSYTAGNQHSQPVFPVGARQGELAIYLVAAADGVVFLLHVSLALHPATCSYNLMICLHLAFLLEPGIVAVRSCVAAANWVMLLLPIMLGTVFFLRSLGL